MIDEMRGREHLARLLAHAETVTRIEPSSLLVLGGVSDDDLGATDFDPLIHLLQQMGIEARGVVILPAGATIDSLDLDALAAWTREAEQMSEESVIHGSHSADGVAVEVPCPLCRETLPVSVRVEILAGAEGMRAKAYAEQAEVAAHGFMCTSDGDAQ